MEDGRTKRREEANQGLEQRKREDGRNLRTRGPTTNNDTINLAEEEAGWGRLGSNRLVSKRGRETAEMEEDGPPAKH